MDCSEAGKVRMMATKTHRTEVTRDLPLMVICAPEQSCPIVWHFSPGDKSNHVFLNMWTSDNYTICTCRKQNQVKKPDVEGLQLRRRKDVPWNRSQPWSAIVWIRRKLQTWKKWKNGKTWILSPKSLLPQFSIIYVKLSGAWQRKKMKYLHNLDCIQCQMVQYQKSIMIWNNKWFAGGNLWFLEGLKLCRLRAFLCSLKIYIFVPNPLSWFFVPPFAGAGV